MTRAVTAVAISLLAMAQTAHAQEKLKFGYVDIAKVLSDSKAGKSAKEQLEKNVKERQAKVDLEKKALETMKGNYEKSVMDLSERQKQTRQKEFQEKNDAYQKMVAEAQKEVRDRDAEYTRKVVEQMRKIIANMAKAEDYTLVVEKTATSVLYSKDGLDLTVKVIQQMDAQK